MCHLLMSSYFSKTRGINKMTTLLLIIIGFLILSMIQDCATSPIARKHEEEGEDREPRQTYQRNPDGSITASFAASEAFNVPGGGGGAFNVAETVNFGPQGITFGGGQSFSSDFGGNRMSFSNANSQNSRFGQNGFSSTGANSASNSFSNPLFSSSNAQANAFGNQNNPFQF